MQHNTEDCGVRRHRPTEVIASGISAGPTFFLVLSFRIAIASKKQKNLRIVPRQPWMCHIKASYFCRKTLCTACATKPLLLLAVCFFNKIFRSSWIAFTSWLSTSSSSVAEETANFRNRWGKKLVQENHTHENPPFCIFGHNVRHFWSIKTNWQANEWTSHQILPRMLSL